MPRRGFSSSSSSKSDSSDSSDSESSSSSGRGERGRSNGSRAPATDAERNAAWRSRSERLLVHTAWHTACARAERRLFSALLERACAELDAQAAALALAATQAAAQAAQARKQRDAIARPGLVAARVLACGSGSSSALSEEEPDDSHSPPVARRPDGPSALYRAAKQRGGQLHAFLGPRHHSSAVATAALQHSEAAQQEQSPRRRDASRRAPRGWPRAWGAAWARTRDSRTSLSQAEPDLT